MASMFTGQWRLAFLGALLLLAAALPSAADAGGGGHGCGLPLTSGAGVEVTVERNCFDPTVVHVTPGDTVTWTNEDFIQHTVTGAQQPKGTFDGGLDSGASFSHTFEDAGVYPYYCAFHVGQVGVVVVGDGEAGDLAAADIDAMSQDATARSDGGSGPASIVAMLAVGGALAMMGGVAYRSARRR